MYKSVNGSELRLHIFNPPYRRTGIATPAIVFFFGGAWTIGTVNQFRPQSKYLADRGMIAILADYRVFGRHKTSAFEAIADAKSAIRWLRAQAPELGIDPNRIAAAGGSSGGHIALTAAVLDQFDDVNEDLAARGKSPDGIRPALHPRWLRCSSLKYDPIFSLLAPCHRGASPVSVLAGTFTTGC